VMHQLIIIGETASRLSREFREAHTQIAEILANEYSSASRKNSWWCGRIRSAGIHPPSARGGSLLPAAFAVRCVSAPDPPLESRAHGSPSPPGCWRHPGGFYTCQPDRLPGYTTGSS
jgi:hypothetical protein